MKINKLIILLYFLSNNYLFGQDSYYQYFDGEDTVCNVSNDIYSNSASVCITINNPEKSIWQIGKPNKLMFSNSATEPNAIVTDTVNFYPSNDTSSFEFTFINNYLYRGIVAIRWKQKIDMDKGFDGGKIEFSTDSGLTWQNAFNNPYVYNFYGFNNDNIDTLVNGDIVFSGTDNEWKDIWFCFDYSWLRKLNSIKIKFTFISDNINNHKEGWLIDNLFIQSTSIHTVNEIKPNKYINVYPNPSSNILNIEIEKIKDFHII